MKIEGSVPRMAPGQQPEKARTPEEAARQFETILVRQFVKTMTDGLFEAGLAGEDGPGWMDSQRTTQRDILTDVLAEHLVDTEALGISKLLLNQWQRSGRVPGMDDGSESTTETP